MLLALLPSPAATASVPEARLAKHAPGTGRGDVRGLGSGPIGHFSLDRDTWPTAKDRVG